MFILPLLYFSSAFGTINHSILVHHPHTDFGFTDSVLQWFSSYLTNCTQYVSLSNHSSAFTEHIGRLARMSVLDTEVDGSNPGSSMLFP